MAQVLFRDCKVDMDATSLEKALHLKKKIAVIITEIITCIGSMERLFLLNELAV